VLPSQLSIGVPLAMKRAPPQSVTQFKADWWQWVLPSSPHISPQTLSLPHEAAARNGPLLLLPPMRARVGR